MEDSKLEKIWRDNLRKYNGDVRLDSIIIIAMREACEHYKETKLKVNVKDKINCKECLNFTVKVITNKGGVCNVCKIDGRAIVDLTPKKCNEYKQI